MRRVAIAGVLVAACSRTPNDAPPAPALASSPPVVASSASPMASAPVDAGAAPITMDLVFGGDVIPHTRLLARKIDDVLAKLPSCWWNADARVLNLEAPIGDRDDLPGDKSLLAYAAPPSWFGDLARASKASAFVVANNHACDLGPEGLARTVDEAEKDGVKIAGAAKDDPWRAVVVAEKEGKRACVVAWTTFLNDKGKKQKGCLEGANGASIARATMDAAGEKTIVDELSKPSRWDGCDAKIAFVHGGREYKAQVPAMIDQASAAAPYVDAVIVSHPHVPDLVTVVAATDGRKVPVFLSLGNFVSNQGVAWSSKMSPAVIEKGGVPDPLSIAWTRVAVIARLRFAWETPNEKASLRYGFSLAFVDRAKDVFAMRPLPDGADDPVAEKLKKGPKPFGALLDDPCRIDAEAAPACIPSAP